MQFNSVPDARSNIKDKKGNTPLHIAMAATTSDIKDALVRL